MATELEALQRAISNPLPVIEWRRPDRTFQLCKRSLRAALRSRGVHGGIVRRMALRARRLLGRELFSVEEILQFGMLNPALSEAQCRRYQSRVAATRMEQLLNPEAVREFVGDKGVFYRRCAELNLPVPRTWGEFSSNASGTARCGRTLTGSRDWESYLTDECPGDLVVKPARCGYGIGVQVFHREKRGVFRDPMGRQMTAAELVAQLNVETHHGTRVVQQLIVNHPDLVALSGSGYLQTVRVITMIDGTGRAHAIHAHCKLIVGGNHVDNFHFGATGNLVVGVDIASGRLREGWTMRLPEGGFSPVTHHPNTGRSIVGFQLPGWEPAMQLATRAAIAFKPLRLVGWDIALTPTDPLLVEGNWNSDPPNATGECEPFVAKIEELL